VSTIEARAHQNDRIGAAALQAFWLLRIGFTVAPILFGIDKFFNWTVHWPDYLAGWINNIMPGTAQSFMYFVGVVEIVAGLVVLVAPAIGGPLVAAWLAGIIINLLTNNPPEYYDIALRDFGLFLGALTLTRLAWAFARQPGRASAGVLSRPTRFRVSSTA
jgi:DoxX